MTKILQQTFPTNEEALAWLIEETSKLEAEEIDYIGCTPIEKRHGVPARITIGLK
jgi:hypothetical protein